MANVTKRFSKNGEVSFLIRVFLAQGPNGRQITKSMTWIPPAGMRPTAAEKQAKKEAILFEEKVRSGMISVDGKTTFADYAAQWMDSKDMAPRTRANYNHLLTRINKAIGHIPLEKIRVEHIQTFINNLREEGVKHSGYFAFSASFGALFKESELTKTKLSELSGAAVSTITKAIQGKQVSVRTANKLCEALGKNMSDVFTITGASEKLSDCSIKHYHTLIRNVLASAKKSRLIPFNVASEFMEAPKLPRFEAKYLSDDEAKIFLAKLLDEPDIRIKTALMLDLFTGLRRGELCGLSWKDIDFTGNVIHVRRASQYIAGQGVIEVPTKNRSSERHINVTPFVVNQLKQYKVWWIETRFKYGDAWQGEKERLFIQGNGKPIFPDTINGWLRKFNNQNGLPQISPHNLRHTFITLQITAGVDIRTLQARSGHAQASTLLDVYSHAIQSAQEKAAQAMDDVLLGKAE